MVKLYLVTGVSSGIGLNICEDLLKEGFKVIGIARNKRECIEKLVDQYPETFFFISKDLSIDINDYKKFLMNLSKTHGKFCGMIHAAGCIKITPNKFNNYNDMLNMFNLNVFSALSLCSAFSDKRISEHKSSIVLIASVAANIGTTGIVNYAASKASLIGAMKSLAKELAPIGTRVNTISPGLIKTKLTVDTCESDFFDRMNNLYPLGLGETQNISDACLFLLSDKSSWITGIDLIVDGGISLGINE